MSSISKRKRTKASIVAISSISTRNEQGYCERKKYRNETNMCVLRIQNIEAKRTELVLTFEKSKQNELSYSSTYKNRSKANVVSPEL